MQFVYFQQQIHAQQLPHGAHGPGLPMGPHPGLPGMGPAAGLLGFGAGLGAGVPGTPGGPHAAVAASAHPLLKPADLHSRDTADHKRPGSVNNEERLVSIRFALRMTVKMRCFLEFRFSGRKRQIQIEIAHGWRTRSEETKRR